MNKNRFVFLLLIAFSISTSAQNDEGDLKRKNCINTVIDGYNSHDYGKMKQPWVGWAKLMLSKNKFKNDYGPLYLRYGVASIDTITYSSKYEYVAKLNMEKSKTTPLYFSFIFSEKGKIQGFGQTYPPLIYKKHNSKAPVEVGTFIQKLDTLLAQKYLKSKTQPFNGSIVVLNEGKILYKKHCGYADFETHGALNDSTLFDLASVSKQFTALAILMLQEEGKLTLTDNVQKFIPDFPYQGISIENLLTHTSGLPEYMPIMKKHWDKSKFANNYDVVNLLKQLQPKPNFQPNEFFEYCNTGFIILSVIIEKTSGKTYSDYLNDNIFLPLGMHHTRVYNTRRAKNETIANCSKGYVYLNEQIKYVVPDSTITYEQVIYLDAITGDGNIHSCINDLILWENELMYPKKFNSELFEKLYQNHTLTKGQTTNYGYGFFISGGSDSERLYYHTGGWPGYFSILMNFFDEKKQIIILSNNSYDNFTRIADDIANMLLEE